MLSLNLLILMGAGPASSCIGLRSSFVRPTSSQLQSILEYSTQKKITNDKRVETIISPEDWDTLNSDMNQTLKNKLEQRIEKNRNKSMDKARKEQGMTFQTLKTLMISFSFFSEITLDPTVCHDPATSCLSSFPPASLASFLTNSYRLTLEGLELPPDLWTWLSVFSGHWATHSLSLSHTSLDSCGLSSAGCQQLCESVTNNCTSSQGGVGGCMLFDKELQATEVTCDNSADLAKLLANVKEVELRDTPTVHCSNLASFLASSLPGGVTERIVVEEPLSQLCKQELEDLARRLGWSMEHGAWQGRMVLDRCVRRSEGRLEGWKKAVWIEGDCVILTDQGQEMVWSLF